MYIPIAAMSSSEEIAIPLEPIMEQLYNSIDPRTDRFFHLTIPGELLGRGNSGQVYSMISKSKRRSQNKELKSYLQSYVLKIIPLRNSEEEYVVQNEFDIHMELNSLNMGPLMKWHETISIKNRRSHNKYAVMCMEKIEPIKPMMLANSEDKQMELINEVARMVSHGYLHNDLHIGNVAVNIRTKMATVIDFGLTKKLETLPREEMLFNQIVLAQLYAILDPCNTNNCSLKSEEWPQCYSDEYLSMICQGPISDEIYKIRTNESELWSTLKSTFTSA